MKWCVKQSTKCLLISRQIFLFSWKEVESDLLGESCSPSDVTRGLSLCNPSISRKYMEVLVWRALEKLGLLLVTPQVTAMLLSFSPNPCTHSKVTDAH